MSTTQYFIVSQTDKECAMPYNTTWLCDICYKFSGLATRIVLSVNFIVLFIDWIIFNQVVKCYYINAKVSLLLVPSSITFIAEIGNNNLESVTRNSWENPNSFSRETWRKKLLHMKYTWNDYEVYSLKNVNLEFHICLRIEITDIHYILNKNWLQYFVKVVKENFIESYNLNFCNQF